MTDKEFFIKAVLAIIPPIAEKNGEAVAIDRAIVTARALTGRMVTMGVVDFDERGTPFITRDNQVLAANLGPQTSPTGQVNGGLVSQQPIQKPVVVNPVTG